MFEKEIAARNELKKAFLNDSLTHFVTQGEYKIDHDLGDLYIFLNNKFVITIHFNHELTQYINIGEIDHELGGFSKRISTFSLDKFFTPEMTVKVLHRAIVELENSYALVLSDN